MDLKLLKRWAEMLDAVSTGLHPAAVVGQLAENYGVSERTWVMDGSLISFLVLQIWIVETYLGAE